MAAYKVSCFLAGALCLTGVIGAQTAQFTAPGSLADEPKSRRNSIQQGIEDASWRVGPFRLDPKLWVRNFSYIDNVYAAPDVESQVSDVTGTVGGGLVAYTRLGQNTIASAFVLPEYVWWQEQTHLRELNGSLGVGLFSYFNRASFEIEGRKLERERPLNIEQEIPVEIKENKGSLGFEIELKDRIALFGSLAADELRHSSRRTDQNIGPNLELLDRDVMTSKLGLQFALGNKVKVGLGAEQSDVDFLDDTGDRSSSGTSPLLTVLANGNHLQLGLDLVLRKLDFSDSAATDVESLTGSIRAAWKPDPRFTLTAFGGRSIVYSAQTPDSFLLEQRYGLAFTRQLGSRARLGLFAETGDAEFDTTTGTGVARVDDLSTFGGHFGLELTEKLILTFGATRTEIQSSLPDFDRSSTALRAGLELGRDLLPW